MRAYRIVAYVERAEAEKLERLQLAWDLPGTSSTLERLIRRFPEPPKRIKIYINGKEIPDGNYGDDHGQSADPSD